MSISKSDINFEIHPPEDLPEYMYPAWIGCLRWAIGEPKILALFKSDTGISYSSPKNGLDILIDKSSGFDPAEHLFRAFVPWFNEHIWGSTDETESRGI